MVLELRESPLVSLLAYGAKAGTCRRVHRHARSARGNRRRVRASRLYVAGLVLGLPLSLVGNVLAFMASATAIKDPTAAGAAATAVAAAFIAVAFSGGAAIQTVVVRARLSRRRRDRHQG